MLIFGRACIFFIRMCIKRKKMTKVQIDRVGITFIVTVTVQNTSLWSYIWPYIAPVVTRHHFDKYSDIEEFMASLDGPIECVVTDMTGKWGAIKAKERKKTSPSLSEPSVDSTGRFKVGGRYDQQGNVWFTKTRRRNST